MATLTDDDHDVLPRHIGTFDDTKGWIYAWIHTKYAWRWREDNRQFMPSRPRLYYPAQLQYKPGETYFAVDGLGRQFRDGNRQFECTINPSSGKFERLCVQARDEFCTFGNSTWDRTVIRNTAPSPFRLATFPFKGIPLERRYTRSSWTSPDIISVTYRWILASLGIIILVSCLENIGTFFACHLD
jgi:hypothetical protein